MTDPQQPPPPPGDRDVPPAPPAYASDPAAASGAPPPAYGQQPYGAAPPPTYGQQQPYAAAPPAYGAPASASVPGRTLGIVAFVLSFFAQPVGLILGIVAMVQSRQAGVKNGWALAAIILSSVLMVIGIIVAIIVFAFVIPAATDEFLQLCRQYGSGIHEINGVTVTLNCP